MRQTRSNTLKKAERLYLRDEITRLFQEGKAFISYPLRVVYLVVETQERKPCVNVPVSMLISVAKRKFKRANKRNRCKRLIRESYRIHKHELFELHGRQKRSLLVGFILLTGELPSFVEIETSMKKALKKLVKFTTEVKAEESS